MSDSTNIENPGFSTPEKLVHKNLEEIIKNIKGRLIIGTFASQMERMVKIIEIAEKYGKKIVVEGRSMKTNIEIATLAGILNVKKDTIIASQDAGSIPPDRIVVLATGAQGEEFAALMRMATKSHKFLRINERDTVLLSSSIIPGNEKTVAKLLPQNQAPSPDYEEVQEPIIGADGEPLRDKDGNMIPRYVRRPVRANDASQDLVGAMARLKESGLIGQERVFFSGDIYLSINYSCQFRDTVFVSQNYRADRFVILYDDFPINTLGFVFPLYLFISLIPGINRSDRGKVYSCYL